jgi:hypothetical protein
LSASSYFIKPGLAIFLLLLAQGIPRMPHKSLSMALRSLI